MKILVIGGKGQLGRCLYDQLSNSEHELYFSSRMDIDISDFKKTSQRIFTINPDLVINASAYTDVDGAQTHQERAELINHLAVANIAEICSDMNCWLIHISTDYVFDGKNSNPYCENNIVNPQSAYGISKLNGEMAIQEKNNRYLIIRTAWLFSEYGNNFLKTMINLGKNRNKLSVVGDQFGCPTYAQDLAIAISSIVNSIHVIQIKSGIYHFCGDKVCSWYEFAQAIFHEAKLQGLKVPQKIEMTTSDIYNSSVNRPKYSVLDCSKILSKFNIPPANLLKGIKRAISNL